MDVMLSNLNSIQLSIYIKEQKKIEHWNVLEITCMYHWKCDHSKSKQNQILHTFHEILCIICSINAIMSIREMNYFFWWWGQNIPKELGQYHGCWSSGSSCHQVINHHDIDYLGYTVSCDPWRGISPTCNISVQKLDTDILLLPQKNSACKCLHKWSHLQCRNSLTVVSTILQQCQLVDTPKQLDYHGIKYLASWVVSNKD